MKKNIFEFTVGSDLDYENLIADIGFDNQLVALITQEEGFENLRIQIYPPAVGDCWDFPLKEFEEVVQKAKQRLWELRKISENDSNDFE